MSNSYTNVFGGENINPADVSYKLYDISTSIKLVWPFEALDGQRVVADKIDVRATAGLTISMPDATLASVGEDVLWNNIGTNAFTVTDYAGNTIITVQPGKQWFTYLVDNTTTSGVWHITQFGAGTSAADAATLAGAGLRANTNLLDQNYLTTDVAGDIVIDSAGRARVFRNTGSGVFYSLALASSLGPPPLPSNGWFIVAINAGVGNIVLTPSGSDLIDGDTSKSLSPGESCVVYCYGSGFATMGHGRALASNVAAININMSGSGPLTLNAGQVAAQVQDYTGTMTGNRNVIYGAGTGYWFIYNNTTSGTGGPFTLSVQGATSDTPAIVIPPSHFTILRSQGGALDIAFTATSGTVTQIATVTGEITGGALPGPPITTTGTIGLADMPTGSGNLTAGTYGTASAVPQFRVDQKGRTAHAHNVNINIGSNQISDIASLLPPAMIIAWGAWITIPIPAGWLPCDGTWRLIADYPNLYGVIGGAYGVATGYESTHFVLPNSRGCVLMGQDALVTAGSASVPYSRVQPAYFPGGDPAVIGNSGGTHAEQSSVPLSGLQVSGGRPEFGWPFNVGWVDGFGAYGWAVGGITIRGDTGVPVDRGTPVTGGGGGAANVDHGHPVIIGTAVGASLESNVFIDPNWHAGHGWSGGRFQGQINYNPDSTHQRRYTELITNVQPTLVVRHLIKT